MAEAARFRRRADRLEAELARVAADLRIGRLAGLGAAADEIGRRLAALADGAPPAGPEAEARLARLRAAAAANLALIEAARDGIAAARARLAGLAAAERAIGLYGAGGRRLPEPGPAARADRRR